LARPEERWIDERVNELDLSQDWKSTEECDGLKFLVPKLYFSGPSLFFGNGRSGP